jgi:hypothetical protein
MSDEKQEQAEAQLPKDAPVIVKRPTPEPPLTASRSPDEATARCINVIDNMHGSDDQRRKVAAAVLDHFSGRDPQVAA